VTISRSSSYVLGALVLVAVLAGCSSGGSQATLPAQTQQSQSPSDSTARLAADLLVGGAAAAVRSDHSGSWMEPNARGTALLYVSDIFTNDVYVYNYPKGTLAGTLTGFGSPLAMCVDKAGNVWIPDYANFEILEYAHGGTSPIAILSDPYPPYSCAVNPRTGDLAVGGRTGIAIYKGAAGTPTVYQGYFAEAREVGYERNTLYISGFGNPSQFEFASLEHGQVTPITISGTTINFPGSVQYVDGQLTLGDGGGGSSDAVIYQLSVSGTTATVTGSTPLSGNSKSYQSVIRKKSVIASNYNAGVANTYEYPIGGASTRTITGGGLAYPFGVAISN
jgi:hypothetical protein